MNATPRILAFPKNGANAYLNLFAAQLEERGAVVHEFGFWRGFLGRYHVLHIHWPETHLRTSSWWRAIAKHVRLALLCVVMRLRRTRIVWTLHNLKPHEPDHWISALLFPLWFPRVCTHVIALSPRGLESARSRFPALCTKPATVVPHGHYRDIYPAVPGRQASRKRLGMRGDAFTFLYFGHIRRYKGVPRLIEAFRALPTNDAQLVVAGQPALGMCDEDLLALAARDGRCALFLRHIPDPQVPVFFGAADLVVLPFHDVLNSGSVLLALSMNRPVLAPRLGALPDIQRAVGSHWLQLYDGPLTVPHLVRARHEAHALGDDAEADLSAFDWSRIGDATLKFYGADNDPDENRGDPPAGKWHMGRGRSARYAMRPISKLDRVKLGWAATWPRRREA